MHNVRISKLYIIKLLILIMLIHVTFLDHVDMLCTEPLITHTNADTTEPLLIVNKSKLELEV